ncbi:hypothetical protein A7U60_g4905 [Sanghuangporus baumii]|uniref:Phytanoyl-CoA dioxygenase family protein n=1 Tax=Sanghuangporus baumii TaxID=108892 RepID=A0A9Q5N8R3_SANBA|nr:hypothetical protein A7U60_g4905 [Sanghuangporus baumii]
MAIKEYKVMTPDLRKQFLEKGWVKIEGAISLENIKKFSDDVWIRLGYDPQDKSTWEKEKRVAPSHQGEILGGEDRIDPTLFESFGDSLICNLGSSEWENKESIDPRLLGNWHIDGDWFTHYLDSGEQALTVIVLFNDIIPRAGGTFLAPDEQALTVIVLFNDIIPRAGGTFLAPDGLKNIVSWLYEHPEGADSWPTDETGARTVCDIHKCQEFVECTGKAGDMIIFHPFMPHSASKNYLRIPRFITNPPVTLKEPLCFTRQNPEDYSLTELVVLRALEEIGINKSVMKDWKIAGKRRRFTPRTRAGKDAMIIAEVERMKAHERRTGGAYKVDSMHLNGPVPYQTVIPTEG